MQTLTPLDAFEALFDELWLALGPKERTDYTQRLTVYHKALRDIRVDSLRIGVERCIQSSRMRALPAPGEIRARALEHDAEMRNAMDIRGRTERPAIPATRCQCGCGGRRWHKVLRDRETNAVRTYPTDVAEQAKLPELTTYATTFRRTLDALVGEPMLRTFVHCKRVPSRHVDAEPTTACYLGLDAEGCPVYDPDRREPRQEVAA
jgi:hypothetical protein